MSVNNYSWSALNFLPLVNGVAKVMFSILSVCLSKGVPVQDPSPSTLMYKAPPLLCTGLCPPLYKTQGSPVLQPLCTAPPPPRHIQIWSLWNPFCRQAGSWHSTKTPFLLITVVMSSLLRNIFLLSVGEVFIIETQCKLSLTLNVDQFHTWSQKQTRTVGNPCVFFPKIISSGMWWLIFCRIWLSAMCG